MTSSIVQSSIIFRKSPVHRGGVLLLEQPVDPTEGFGAEEPPAGAQGRRVHGLDPGDRTQQRLERLGVAAPQDRDARAAPLGQGGDGAFGDRLPALALVAVGVVRPHGEAPVEQHHPLVGPRRQVAVPGRGDPEVVLQLDVDVDQARRQRPHVPLDGEAQTDRMGRVGIGVLSHDQHPYVGERAPQRPEDQVAGRLVAAPRRHLLAEEAAHGGDPVVDRRQRLRPVGRDEAPVDETGQRADLRAHAGRRTGRCSRSRKALSNASRIAGDATSSMALTSAIRDGSSSSPSSDAPTRPDAASRPSKSSSVSEAGSRASMKATTPASTATGPAALAAATDSVRAPAKSSTWASVPALTDRRMLGSSGPNDNCGWTYQPRETSSSVRVNGSSESSVARVTSVESGAPTMWRPGSHSMHATMASTAEKA